MHAAISKDRQDIAVAGTRGLAVYSRRARRWRLFGDATQERLIRVGGGCLLARASFWVQLEQVLLRAWALCVSNHRNARHVHGRRVAARCAMARVLTRSLPSPARPLSPLPNQVHGLMWLPGGVIAVVAHVEGAGRGQEAASPQLLLYPHHHLDSASLLARMPLQQVRQLILAAAAARDWF